MTSSTLKIIGIICMLLDHIGATLLPEVSILRIIGRLAFPIFVFLLVEGYYHTKDINKYLLRLGIFALISEMPFDLAFMGKVYAPSHQNVFLTLFLGLLMIKLFNEHKVKNEILAGLSVIICVTLSIVLRTDYSIFGMIMIFIYYQFRNDKLKAAIYIWLINTTMGLLSAGLFAGEFNINGMTQTAAVLAIPLIYIYNGKKGISLKYIFYGFYPIHLLVLYFLQVYINKY